MPKISIILPYYNDKEFLAESIQSVLDQSFTDFELILINHASTDDSERIAKSFKDSRTQHIKLETNQGAGGGHILKAFLNVAKGEYFKSMCADDILKSNCLELLSSYLDNDNNCIAVFGDMEFIDKDGKLTGEKWWNYKKFNLDDSILEKYFIGDSILPFPSAMVRIKELRKLNIDNVIFGMFDMSLWVQLLVKNLEIKCISNIVCQYRIHENQESSSTKSEKLIRVANYECHIFYKYFLKLPISTIKKLLPNDRFARIAGEEDNDFVVAHHFSLSGALGVRFFAIQHLHRILQDDTRKQKIENKFGYTVYDLRKNYSDFVLPFDLSAIKTSKLLKEVRRRFKKVFFRRELKVV